MVLTGTVSDVPRVVFDSGKVYVNPNYKKKAGFARNGNKYYNLPKLNLGREICFQLTRLEGLVKSGIGLIKKVLR